jgi:hypothetical protein
MDIVKVAQKTARSYRRRQRSLGQRIKRLPPSVCTLIGAALGAGACYTAFLLGLFA